jgi:hypothetical protein
MNTNQELSVIIEKSQENPGTSSEEKAVEVPPSKLDITRVWDPVQGGLIKNKPEPD